MSKANQPVLDKLAELNKTVLDVTGDVTEAEWQLNSVSEDWPLGLLLSHIANGYSNVAGWIQKVIEGQPLPITIEDIGEANDKAEAEYTPKSGSELLAHLKAKIEGMTKLIESLTDEQLTKVSPMALAGGREVTPVFLVERVLINHTRGHLESFRLTLASVRDEITT